MRLRNQLIFVISSLLVCYSIMVILILLAVDNYSKLRQAESKAALFLASWNDLYNGSRNYYLSALDPNRAKTEFDNSYKRFEKSMSEYHSEVSALILGEDIGTMLGNINHTLDILLPRIETTVNAIEDISKNVKIHHLKTDLSVALVDINEQNLGENLDGQDRYQIFALARLFDEGFLSNTDFSLILIKLTEKIRQRIEWYVKITSIVFTSLTLVVIVITAWAIRRILNINSELDQMVIERTSELKTIQKDFLRTAHTAGMTEIATSVMHEIGNVLNSTLIAINRLSVSLEAFPYSDLSKVNRMIKENIHQIDTFFTKDPKGKKLPGFLTLLEQEFEKNHEECIEQIVKIHAFGRNIRNIIRSKDSYAATVFYNEDFILEETIRDMVSFHFETLKKHKILVKANFEGSTTINGPKTKILHVFLCLLNNAIESLNKVSIKNRVIEISLKKESENTVSVTFRDNGVGIEEKFIDRVFNHGFTTKKDGNGFGLHLSANTLSEMNGSIRAKSNGLGTGAEFLVIIPVKPTTHS